MNNQDMFGQEIRYLKEQYEYLGMSGQEIRYLKEQYEYLGYVRPGDTVSRGAV